MVDHPTRAGRSPYAAPPVQWGLVSVWWASGLALVLAVVGVVDGLRIASGGTGDDARPADAGIGVAIVVVSFLLGILVVFTGVLVRAHVEGRAPQR